MPRFAWGAALAGLFTILLVASAPARLLAWVLPSEQVVMQGFSGSLWRGEVARCLVFTGAGYLHLGELTWSLKPLSLLLFAPSLEFHSQWGEQIARGEVTAHGAQDLSLADLDARFPAKLLRQLAPVAVAGSFSIQAQQLRLHEGLPVSALGRVVWERGAWLSPRGVMPLGSYALDFEQREGNPLTGEVVTLEGPIAAAGTASLTGRAFDIDVVISSDQTLDDQLRQALSLVASPQGEGFNLKLSGQL